MSELQHTPAQRNALLNRAEFICRTQFGAEYRPWYHNLLVVTLFPADIDFARRLRAQNNVGLFHPVIPDLLPEVSSMGL